MSDEIIRVRKGSIQRPYVVGTVGEIAKFIREAKPGDWCTYWTGYLAYDRSKTTPRASYANSMGRAALQAYLDGFAFLAQRRMPPKRDVQYLLCKAKQRRKP